MEQSPLLQVVQRRLCSAHFEDVEGSTEQLTHFALRALRVLWFDLRRSTCTLKRIPCDPQEGTTLLCLLMKPLKLQLCCDCDAELATFPYVRLACGAQVTVKGVVISIEVVASTTGMQLRGVDGLNVVVPELEVKLSDAPLLSRIAVSAVLAIFQTTLQEHLQRQLQIILGRLLERELLRWNGGTWDFLRRVVPNDMLDEALSWLDEHIPPEGIPI